MNSILLVYITFETIDEAKHLGKHLLEKKLCACVNILPEMYPMLFWPRGSSVITEGKEVLLIAKTTEEKYKALEIEVEKLHPYEVPCIIAIPTAHVNKAYRDWIVGELS